MPNPVVHFEIVGKDGRRLQQFYGELFGWTINADNPHGYGLVDTGSGGIGGGIGTTDGPNWVTIYVEVPDLQATLQKAESLGGRTLMPPTEIPGAATLAMFADPEGNIIGLLKARD